MSEWLEFRQQDSIVTITLNQPDTLNAVTDQEMCDAILEAVDRLNADASVRCAILTGAGKAFSSGGNLKQMKSRSGAFAGDVIAIKNQYRGGIQRVVRAVWECEVVLIAAVNGPAYGAGCDLACFCDIRIASTQAVFAENFVSVGLISGDGGSWVLPRQIGLSHACEMAFTGDPVDAETALRYGLVSQVVEPEALHDSAMTLAQRIARNPAEQLRMTKRLIRQGTQSNLATVLDLAAAYQGMAHHTDAHQVAMEKFS